MARGPAWLKTSAAALALTAGLAACAPAKDAQAEPGILAKLPDGRTLNFYCTGSGSPTVVLESGFGVGTFAWGKSQPRLAKITRVCSYDRAGYGFSDPGPEPRDGAAIARDLDQGLVAADITGPYILVGHSAGGLYARLLAARRPGEVQGLILLDPTVERRAAPGADGLGGIRRRLQRCLAASETAPRAPRGDPQWQGCIGPKTDARMEANARQPATWRNQISELDAIFGRTSEQVARTHGLLGDVPIYVITASETAASASTIGYDKPQSVWELQHVRLALESEHGYQRTVLASHLLHNDRPEVVAEVVRAMVKAVRDGLPPPPLPPSETAEAAGEAAFPETPR